MTLKIGHRIIVSSRSTKLVRPYLISFTFSFLFFFNFDRLPFFWWGDEFILWNQANSLGGYQSSFEFSMLQDRANKYRPVIQLIFSLLVIQIGENSQIIHFMVVSLLAFSAHIIGKILSAKFGNKLIHYFFGALILAASPFTWFSTAQMNYGGLMESLALLFMLLFIKFSLDAIDSRKNSHFALASIFFGLAVFTHERYLLAGIAASSIFKYIEIRQNSAPKTIIYSPLYVILFNFFVKTFIFNISISQGSLSNIGDSGFTQTLLTIFWNLDNGILKLIGIDQGISNLHKIFFMVINLFLLFTMIFLGIKKQISFDFKVLFLFGIFISVFVPVLFETVLQDRFFLLPFVLLVIALSFLFNLLGSKSFSLALGVYLFSCFAVITPFRNSYDPWIQNLKVIYGKTEMHLNSTSRYDWYIVLNNQYSIEDTWYLGYLDPNQPERLGVFYNFPNPPLIFAAKEGLAPNRPCFHLTIEPGGKSKIIEC